MKNKNKRVLTETEASEYLGLSRSTLSKGRMDGRRKRRMKMPPFVKMGRAVRYLIEDLDRFLAQNRVGDSGGV